MCICGRPRWLSSKESAHNAGEPGFIPGLKRSPGGRPGNPLQYSCQEDPVDRGAWRAMVNGARKSQTWQKWHTRVYVWLIHFAVQQKLTQYWKAAIFQLGKRNFRPIWFQSSPVKSPSFLSDFRCYTYTLPGEAGQERLDHLVCQQSVMERVAITGCLLS